MVWRQMLLPLPLLLLQFRLCHFHPPSMTSAPFAVAAAQAAVGEVLPGKSAHLGRLQVNRPCKERPGHWEARC